MKKPLLGLIAALVLVAGSARGQANLSFSGGNGSPFSLTLNQPVDFTITTTFGNGSGPFFIFQNVGNLFNQLGSSVSGNITFSINGGANQPITDIDSGTSGGDVGPNDMYIYGALTGANAGDVIHLNAGTITTTGNVAAAPPPNGFYNAFITDENANRVSNIVPEPQSAALLLAGGLGFLFLMRKRFLIVTSDE